MTIQSIYSEETRTLAEAHPENKKRLEPDKCQVCATIQREGWNGESNLSHCRNCHAVWSGIASAHCTLCHRLFSSNSAVDLAHSTHRDSKGELRRICKDPSTISALVQLKNEFGTLVWKGAPMDEAAKAVFQKDPTVLTSDPSRG